MNLKKKDIHDQFLAIYEEYNQPIFRYFALKVWDRELAKDLTQEVFIRFWGYIEKGGEIREKRAFLYKIAHNLLVDEIRRKKPIVSLDGILEEGFDFGQNPNEEYEMKDFASQIFPKLDELEDSYKQVLIMKYVDDLSIKEIAKILEIPDNTVSVRLHRAHTKLKKIIEDY